MKTLCSILFIALFTGIAFSQSSAELKYKLEKGKVYKAKSSSVINQKMTMQGQDRFTETTSIAYVSLKMLDAKPEFFIAEVKFDTMITKVSAPPMNLNSADTGDIASSDPVQVTNCILHRLANSTLVVKMDYKGYVQDIMNYNVIQKTLLEGIDSLKGQAAMAKGQLETLAGKNNLKGMIEGITAYLPGTETATGDKWESTFTSYSGGAGMTITSTNKLVDLSKKIAVIKGDIILQPASSEPTMMGGAEIVNETSGLGKSTSEINPKTGWVIKGSSEVQMSGNMIASGPGYNMTIPIESKLESEIIAVE